MRGRVAGRPDASRRVGAVHEQRTVRAVQREACLGRGILQLARVLGEQRELSAHGPDGDCHERQQIDAEFGELVSGPGCRDRRKPIDVVVSGIEVIEEE